MGQPRTHQKALADASAIQSLLRNPVPVGADQIREQWASFLQNWKQAAEKYMRAAEKMGGEPWSDLWADMIATPGAHYLWEARNLAEHGLEQSSAELPSYMPPSIAIGSRGGNRIQIDRMTIDANGNLSVSGNNLTGLVVHHASAGVVATVIQDRKGRDVTPPTPSLSALAEMGAQYLPVLESRWGHLFDRNEVPE